MNASIIHALFNVYAYAIIPGNKTTIHKMNSCIFLAGVISYLFHTKSY
jgi:hypothetical protein